MKLHENSGIFSEIIEKTALKSGYRADVIEKDYYVILFLKELAEKQSKDNLKAYFKGGTSLYKRLKNAQRFSEDIDLSVDTRDCNSNQNKKRLNNATKDYSSLERNKDKGISNKYSVISYYNYNSLLNLDNKNDPLERFGQIMIEATSFTISEPVIELQISSFIYDYADEKTKAILDKEYNLAPFSIKSLSMERLFIDKLFATEAYIRKDNDPKKAFDVAKHLYDLNVLINLPEIKKFVSNESSMKNILNIRLKEELNRKDGIPGVFPSDFTFFEKIHNNSKIEEAYKKMLSIYVFNDKDRISYSSLLNSLSNIQDSLVKNPSWNNCESNISSQSYFYILSNKNDEKLSKITGAKFNSVYEVWEIPFNALLSQEITNDLINRTCYKSLDDIDANKTLNKNEKQKLVESANTVQSSLSDGIHY